MKRITKRSNSAYEQMTFSFVQIISVTYCDRRRRHGKMIPGKRRRIRMTDFNLNNWIKMFNSSNEEVVMRTCQNAHVINDYVWGGKKADAALKAELTDFNRFAKEHEGYTVYDVSVANLQQSGIREVGEYMVSLGRSR